MNRIQSQDTQRASAGMKASLTEWHKQVAMTSKWKTGKHSELEGRAAALPNSAAASMLAQQTRSPFNIDQAGLKWVPLDRLQTDNIELFTFLHIVEKLGISYGPRQALASFSPPKWGSVAQFWQSKHEKPITNRNR